MRRDRLTEVAEDVFLWRRGVINVYVLRSAGSGAVVDAGLPWMADELRSVAERVLGRPPAALLLTHGHLDHTGSALALARAWSIPVYVHDAEFPFVRGERNYPPAEIPDPPPRGFMRPFAPGFLPRWLERRVARPVVAKETLGEVARPFNEQGGVPELPDWRVIPTPGHSPGHVAFFRERERVLLSGDALLTLDADSVMGVLSMRCELSRPPSPVTVDWTAAWDSIRKMAELDPSVICAGHGLPLSGPGTATALRAFAAREYSSYSRDRLGCSRR